MGRVDRSSDPWSAVAAGGLSAQELPPAGVGVPRRHRWDAVTLERLAVRLASSSKLGGMGAQTGAVGGDEDQHFAELYPTRLRAIGTRFGSARLRAASSAGPLLVGGIVAELGIRTVVTRSPSSPHRRPHHSVLRDRDQRQRARTLTMTPLRRSDYRAARGRSTPSREPPRGRRHNNVRSCRLIRPPIGAPSGRVQRRDADGRNRHYRRRPLPTRPTTVPSGGP